jgi:hypothetical protein
MMDPQNLEVGIWAFNNNEAELSIAETGSTFETATITTLNETTLQLLYAETVSGNTYITEIIYSH